MRVYRDGEFRAQSEASRQAIAAWRVEDAARQHDPLWRAESRRQLSALRARVHSERHAKWRALDHDPVAALLAATLSHGRPILLLRTLIVYVPMVARHYVTDIGDMLRWHFNRVRHHRLIEPLWYREASRTVLPPFRNCEHV